MEKRNVPEVRFKDFTDDWERRKFGDIVDIYKDPVPTPKNGYTRLGIRSHAKGTFYNYVERGRELEAAQMHRVASGKFIVNITFGWEHAVAITDKNDDGKLVSHRFPQFSFHKCMVPDFFRYVIVDDAFRQHLYFSSPGGAGRNRVLKIDEMLNYPMFYPFEDEQKQIAAFFNNLYTLIDYKQIKCEKLKLFKESMLDKMFPKNGERVPEIRFKGFGGDWERRELGDVVDIFSGRDYKHLSAGDIPVYGTGGHMLSVNEALSYERDAIGIGRKGTIDKPYILHAPFWTVDTLFYVIPRESSNIDFIYDIFQTVEWEKKDESTGVPSLSKNAINNTQIMIPSSKEQRKIGLYFKELDNLITLYQLEYEKLNLFKEAMLDKMFV